MRVHKMFYGKYMKIIPELFYLFFSNVMPMLFDKIYEIVNFISIHKLRLNGTLSWENTLPISFCIPSR